MIKLKHLDNVREESLSGICKRAQGMFCAEYPAYHGIPGGSCIARWPSIVDDACYFEAIFIDPTSYEGWQLDSLYKPLICKVERFLKLRMWPWQKASKLMEGYEDMKDAQKKLDEIYEDGLTILRAYTDLMDKQESKVDPFNAYYAAMHANVANSRGRF